MNNDNAVRSIHVVVVAPALLAWGLARLFETVPSGFEVTHVAPSLDEAGAALRQDDVDVVVLDLDQSIDPRTIAQVKGQTRAAVVCLTSSDDKSTLDQAVVAGVRGVVRKTDAPGTLLKAVERVHEGELWIDRSAAGRIFMEMARQSSRQHNDPDRIKIASLTTRERQMISAVTSDASAPGKVIAQRLCISEHTLRNHLSSIYSKLGLSNRVDLYAYATRHGLDRHDRH